MFSKGKRIRMKHTSLKVLLTIVAGFAVAAEDWPQYMGPNRDGTVAAPGLFGGKVALERIWIQPLGSGFSGIVVGEGKLYTMHTAGEMDAISCFDAATGKKLWSFEYGTSFPKVGSSEPGPLSTPVLDGDRIYGLGALGELFCLEANSGKRIWARNIIEELGTVRRDEGIATSPLVSGELLILNVGDRKDKGIAAFDKRSGALAWHLGEEPISFQTPALVTLMGREQVVALSENKMRGLDPATGAIIWERKSKDWIQMIAIGEDLMLSGHYHGFSLYRIGGCLGDIQVTEQWNNPYLTLEYNMPVHYKGYLFGFKHEFVTCLNVETGEKVWSSREVGGGMAILADRHLAIIGTDGIFRIARAWEKGYEERAKIRVFEQSGITAPSYADRVFYMRNYTQLAAVRVKE